jgi:tetratricopeptide (TPR) repeat protein
MSVTKRLIAGAIALAAITGFAVPTVQAQTAQQLDWCYGKDGATPDLTIGGCTAAIQSGKYDGKDLAAFFVRRGAAYSNKGEFDRAIQDYDQAIKLNPNRAAAFYNRGIDYRNKGQTDRAIQDYDQAIKLDPSFAQFFNNRGSAYHHKGEPDRAIQNYDQAIKLNPTYAAAFFNRSLAKEKMGDKAGAEADLAAARKIDPKIGK